MAFSTHLDTNPTCKAMHSLPSLLGHTLWGYSVHAAFFFP